MNFDRAGALAAGYTEQEIAAYLAQQARELASWPEPPAPPPGMIELPSEFASSLFIWGFKLVQMAPTLAVLFVLFVVFRAIQRHLRSTQTARLEHMTNFHYYDYEDRYYNYAQRQWILK